MTHSSRFDPHSGPPRLTTLDRQPPRSATPSIGNPGGGFSRTSSLAQSLPSLRVESSLLKKPIPPKVPQTTLSSSGWAANGPRSSSKQGVHDGRARVSIECCGKTCVPAAVAPKVRRPRRNLIYLSIYLGNNRTGFLPSLLSHSRAVLAKFARLAPGLNQYLALSPRCSANDGRLTKDGDCNHLGR